MLHFGGSHPGGAAIGLALAIGFEEQPKLGSWPKVLALRVNGHSQLAGGRSRKGIALDDGRLPIGTQIRARFAVLGIGGIELSGRRNVVSCQVPTRHAAGPPNGSKLGFERAW